MAQDLTGLPQGVVEEDVAGGRVGPPGRFTLSSEVDKVRWVRMAEAVYQLTYERDPVVLIRLLDLLASSESDT